jgi:hypothetical protein
MSDEDKSGTAALRGEALRRAIRETIEPFLDLQTHEIFIFGSEATPGRNDRSENPLY